MRSTPHAVGSNPRGFWPSPGVKVLFSLSDPTIRGKNVMEKKIDTAAELVELTEEEVRAVAGGGPQTEGSTGVKGYM